MTGVLDLVCAGLVLMAAYEIRIIRIFPEFMNGTLLWFGSRSYSIYLAHIPIFFSVRECMFRWDQNFAAKGVGDLYLMLIILSLLIVFFISELLHRVWELPMLIRGRKIAMNYETVLR